MIKYQPPAQAKNKESYEIFNKMEKLVYILGVGHNTVTFMDLVEDCGHQIAGLLHYNHDRVGEMYFDYKIDGCFEDLMDRPSLEGMNFTLSMGDISIRKRVYSRIIAKGGNVPTLIHPSSVVSKRSEIGNGVIVMPQNVIEADTIIEDNTTITVNSTIAHSSKVGKHSFISGHCIVGAYITIEEEVQIGQGCTLVSGTVNRVGGKSVLGAGSVLRTDMKPNSVYLGNPARFIRKIE